MGIDREVCGRSAAGVVEYRRWLREQMNPYFFIAMKDEPDALAILERSLGTLEVNRRLILADRDKSLVLALVSRPGTLYETLLHTRDREVSYAMIAHSGGALPGMADALEIQRFEYDRKTTREILEGRDTVVPAGIRGRVRAELRRSFPEFDLREFDALLQLIWLNNESYVRISPPMRVARILMLLQRGARSGGLYFNAEDTEAAGETRILFAVGNASRRDFFLQVMEVFNRLELGVSRAYCLTISSGIHPWFLGTFYVRRRDGVRLTADSELCARLGQELSATQLLTTTSPTYRNFVTTGVLSGEDAALVNAFIAFCHTNLAHNQPDRFGLEDVQSAFHAHPEIALQLATLFRIRFDPADNDREARYGVAMADALFSVNEYNTGHRYLDELRKTIFRCCLTFIMHTLKTNFFVLEKQALAFRLDPAFLADLGADVTGDLPQAVPFRVTFFFSSAGFGYHIGFSDIARGGWRTVIARTPDDFVSNANTLFRENFVLAHTQHLKNKDIYEGGSKLVTILDATDQRAGGQEQEEWLLYKLQYGVASAFLDIYVTDRGVARHPAVVDYYREDEPIELGPDENMHDAMIEAIAALSRQRGYLLGSGIISSKRVGINHKEYGVTSTGVVKFAEITMQELGIDIRTDPFTVKFTGGPNGDVAGNAMRLVLDRCPKARIALILDGTAALCDPAGADRQELMRILLADDLHAYDPEALHPGGLMLFRTGTRKEGLRELFRKVVRTADGLTEEWISIDEFSREFADLVFTVPADLFIPGGGRPETIDRDNWQRFILPDGKPSAQVIVEGANSFITPEARVQLQKKGVIIMRDASANKCGVISSSYEIIANLLLSDTEFLAEKERYVAGVLEILEKRAEDEARLILRRHREPGSSLLYTEISDAISNEINTHYAHLYRFFQERPHLCTQPLFRRAILNHLPRVLREEPRYRRRIGTFPPKYTYAILAAEIGSSLVYQGDQEAGFEESIRAHLQRCLPPAGK
jgi:glutamate dehydrogenase